jgi:spectinomycin phosphotransferase
MLERPHLDDAVIICALRHAYAISPIDVHFLPIGYDANAWVFRIDCADGLRYFLKVRQGSLYRASLTIPSYLDEQGVRQVVAPIRTVSNTLSTHANGFTLILYPFINGGNGAEVGMTDADWRAFGALLKQIHTTALPPVHYAQIRQETFVPQWAKLIGQLQAKLIAGDYDGPQEEALAIFWLARQDEIERIVETTVRLGEMLQAQPLARVLCHADAHTHNVLFDGHGRLHLVDWDGVILAPKERDLMFMLSSGTDEHPDNRDALCFRDGYGEVDVNPIVLAYYRYEWVVQEIGDYGERVFLTKDTGDVTQRESVADFIELFDPGDVVEEAYAAYPLI